MWHTIGFVTEGIIVAAASFYVRYPADFVLLLILLFLVDSVMNFFQRGTSPEAKRFLGANFLLSIVMALLFIGFNIQWRPVLFSTLGFQRQWVPFLGHKPAVFFVGVVAAIAVNTYYLLSRNRDRYFPMLDERL